VAEVHRMGETIAVRKNIALEMCHYLIQWTPRRGMGPANVEPARRSESSRDRSFSAASDFQVSADQLQQQGSGCWCRVGFEVVEDVWQGREAGTGNGNRNREQGVKFKLADCVPFSRSICLLVTRFPFPLLVGCWPALSASGPKTSRSGSATTKVIPMIRNTFSRRSCRPGHRGGD
jgi:hypothetical protein